ncbi:hypothetical protein QR680_013986 [Steinernema hermaphroditum]|uniref:Uncharacterized protein n=1 Tax=Steinernema hermaphroditum TaxID=289476 RepID=A0AA39I8R9_9BILA|nr:hypothetical protein QR680_013986 [Steinernema hermaphroditum]
MVAGMAYTRVFTRSIKRPTFNYGFKLGFCTGSASAATVGVLYLAYNCFLWNQQFDSIHHYAVSQDLKATFPFLACRDISEEHN